eukprot:CAMPEP_0206020454 /NCGR_PEP_ID=MMETSP1464-20131121/31090_1 /ASSEMBLY_ACC=CAM_ASM_001124 /TAXON_ID=119497 /ORGANISM="Exanthemachrysis gayraliae, Strain RCC1523" /LENGTH=42 /DNA_ID= /DNA_START= /DNA_END= /DNA_ORIENTATION=
MESCRRLPPALPLRPRASRGGRASRRAHVRVRAPSQRGGDLG